MNINLLWWILEYWNHHCSSPVKTGRGCAELTLFACLLPASGRLCQQSAPLPVLPPAIVFPADARDQLAAINCNRCFCGNLAPSLSHIKVQTTKQLFLWKNLLIKNVSLFHFRFPMWAEKRSLKMEEIFQSREFSRLEALCNARLVSVA